MSISGKSMKYRYPWPGKQVDSLKPTDYSWNLMINSEDTRISRAHPGKWLGRYRLFHHKKSSFLLRMA
jgi:hypothetical protein